MFVLGYGGGSFKVGRLPLKEDKATGFPLGSATRGLEWACIPPSISLSKGHIVWGLDWRREST